MRLLCLTLLVLLSAGWFVFRNARKGTPSGGYRTARVVESDSSSAYTGTLVIARNERVYAAESNTTLDYIAAEGSAVRRLDAICKVYSSGYNQTEISRLQEYRDEIQEYHVNQVFSNYVDAALDSENRQIASYAGQVAGLVHSGGTGSLSRLEAQLTSSLNARKAYLKQKYPDDQTLNELYKIENDQLKKIESWTMTETAKEDCIVSFYTDGFEEAVNANTYMTLNAEDIRRIIRGVQPERTSVSRGTMSIYRTVQDDDWYGLFLCQDATWSPENGATYQVLISGFEGEPITATLEQFTRAGNDLLLRLRVTERGSVRSVMNIRSCSAMIVNYSYGYYVPESALYTMNGMMGVVVDDGAGGLFIEVTRLGTDDSKRGVLIRPVKADAPLNGSSRVLLINE